jgi:hypothetical protein
MLAAVFATLLLVLVHPLCSVSYAGITVQHASAATADAPDPLPENCCSDASDGALMTPVEVFVASTGGATPGVAAVSWVRLPAFSDAGIAASTALTNPPRRSYYARSARIRR